LPTQALAFLAVFVYATHATYATQAIAFEWKPGLRHFTVSPRILNMALLQLQCETNVLTYRIWIFYDLPLLSFTTQRDKRTYDEVQCWQYDLLMGQCQRCNLPCRGHGMPPTAVTFVERFHINHVASATRALICLVTLTFDLLTLNLMLVIARSVATFLPI